MAKPKRSAHYLGLGPIGTCASFFVGVFGVVWLAMSDFDADWIQYIMMFFVSAGTVYGVLEGGAAVYHWLKGPPSSEKESSQNKK